ncbi:MAG: CvpA family protein [Alistipes sp.]|jgi:membrane protein required for colicin V production|nr:CvpA family protein [Alistipes sp.]
MNWIDIVIGLLLVLAVWQGWRQGVITQILGLAALGLGVVMAWRWGGDIGGWMGLEQNTAWVVGFVVVLMVVVLAVWLIGRITRGLFRIVGLGVFDNVLGVLFSALKMALFVGLFMMVLDFFDPEGRVVTASVRQGSVVYRAVDGVCDVIFPFIKDMFGRL